MLPCASLCLALLTALPPPPPVEAHFLKLDGPAANLRWGSLMAFEITQDSFGQLSTAFTRNHGLFVRAYTGDKKTLKSRTGADRHDCINFPYELWAPIELVRRDNKFWVQTQARIDRTWFNQVADIDAVVVIDEGKLHETSTRVHKDLVGAYFDSGMQIRVNKQRESGETVNTGWKGQPGAPVLEPNFLAPPPPVREKRQIGHVVKFTNGKTLEILDLETRQPVQIDLTRKTFEKNDAKLLPRERILIIEMQDAARRISVWTSLEPECLRPEWLPQRSYAGLMQVAAVVERCDAGIVAELP